MDLKIGKLTVVGFGAMAALTIFQYLFYTGPVSFFKTPWIWYLKNASNFTLFTDGVIFFILALVVLSGLYYHSRTKKFPVVGIVLLLLFAIFIKPLGSSDFAYFFTVGKISSAGKNIYLESWQIENFGSPAVVGTAGERVGLTYGPLVVPAFRTFYELSGGNLLVFTLIMKIFNIVGVFLCGITLFYGRRILGFEADRTSTVVFLLSSPLVLFEAVVNGHFDVWWLLFVLLAGFFASKNMWHYAVPAIVVSIWIKFIPIIILPIFLVWFVSKLDKKNYLVNFRKLIVGSIVALAISFAAWRGMWAGFEVFSSLSHQSNWISMSIYHVVYNITDIFFDPNADFILFNYVGFFSTVALFVISLYLLFPVIKYLTKAFFHKLNLPSEYFGKAIFLTIMVYLLLMQKGIWPWYFVWPFVLGAAFISKDASKHFKQMFSYISGIPILFYPIVFLFLFVFKISTFTWYFFYVLLLALLNIAPLYFIVRWRKEEYK